MKKDLPNKLPKFAFFGTSDFAVTVLEELEEKPTLVITTPDKPKGRKMILTPPPVKIWAADNKVPILQPEKLKDSNFVQKLIANSYQLFVVAAYGKIIPPAVLDIPRHGVLNIHPSLLPKYRGASPLQFQILSDEKDLGISIIKMDEEVDHGPVVTQEKFQPIKWPVGFKQLEKETAKVAAKLLKGVLQPYLAGQIKPVEQNQAEATFTRLLKKEDGLLDLSGDPYQNYLKYLAFEEWPGTYFFYEKNGKKIRMKIRAADFEGEDFKIRRVIPENKKETSYQDFLKWLQ